jgi:anthranilate phosphoribosyltransferase
MKNLLNKILNHESLTYDDSREFIFGIEENKINSDEAAGIMVGIQMRGIRLEELDGFRSALLDLCIPVPLDADNAIDLCGTGGDGKNTFNISTTTSLVLAAMGKKVIKHGNYGVSSVCGSSNVLEELGFRFKETTSDLNNDLEASNICFIHAPLFHPTMKKIATTRKNLGVRTLFNSLGPIVNPAQPAYQLTGTYSLELAKMYQHILSKKRNNFNVAYGMDGYDEITLTNSTRILGKYDDKIITATTFEAERISPNSIESGSTIQSAAAIIRNIIAGKGTREQQVVVAANVATAMSLYENDFNYIDLFNEANSFITSGQTAKHFKINA